MNTAFLAACRGEAHDHVPIRFMRQARHSLAEHGAPRGTGSFLDAIRQPELACEITLQSVRRYGVDAAVLFSDIVAPLAAIDFGVDVVPEVGPVVEQPFRDASDLTRLRPLEPDEDTPYVLETIHMLVRELEVPLIGFAGAPFTMASFLIEGRPSHTHAKAKVLMRSNPDLWHKLMSSLANLAITSLRSQVLAGATAVELFDSAAGSVDPTTYEHFVLPHNTRIFKAMADMMAPRLHSGVGTGELLTAMTRAGSDVVSVDWRVPIDTARGRIGPLHSLQGNLDPALCLGPWDVVAEAAREVLNANSGNPGFIFSLGHEVLPGTDPEILERLVDLVHREGHVADLDEFDRTGSWSAPRPGTNSSPTPPPYMP